MPICETILGHKVFISELVFKVFMALFKTIGMQKDVHQFLELFQERVILKKAISERWYKEGQ